MQKVLRYARTLHQQRVQLLTPTASGQRQSPQKLLTTKKEKNMKNENNFFDCLAVTNVQVFPFKEGANLGHMKGLASIVLNDQIQIRGLRVMDGENGLYVGYPVDLYNKGEDFRSLVMPITRQLREHIENCVLEKYQAAIA